MLRTIGYLSFYKTALEEVVIPASVRSIEPFAFNACKQLKKVVFEEGSRLRELKSDCFSESGLRSLTLLRTVQHVDSCAFGFCDSLAQFFVEDGSVANIVPAQIQEFAKVGPVPNAVVKGVSVWDLRKLKEISIPEGARRIGNHWFCRC